MDVLSCVGVERRRQALRTLRKGLGISSRRRKHGTTGRLALPHQNTEKGGIAETVRSAPGQGPTDERRYKHFGRPGKGKPRGVDRRCGRNWVGRLRLTGKAPTGSFGPACGCNRRFSAHPGSGLSRKILKNKIYPYSPASKRGKGMSEDAYDGSIHLSGSGFPGRRHGQG